MKKRDDVTSRRNLLKKVGSAGLLGAIGLPSIGSASTSQSASKGPILATGIRIDRYVPEGGMFRYEEQFVSDALVDRYGDTTVEFDAELHPREWIPEEYKNPDRAFTRKYEYTATVGTVDEHARAERVQRDKLQSSTGVTTQSQPYYYGPLYAYKNGDVLKRTGPINVGWRRYFGYDANDVEQKMYRDAQWDGGYPAHDRYVLFGDGSTLVVQDEHVAKPTGPSDQYHDRLWTLPTSESDDYSVIAQAHHDPWCHCCCDWWFDGSREYNLKTWRDWVDGVYYTDNIYVGNGSGYGGDDSSQGYFGIVW